MVVLVGRDQTYLKQILLKTILFYNFYYKEILKIISFDIFLSAAFGIDNKQLDVINQR